MGDFVYYYLKPTKEKEIVRLVDYATDVTRKHSLAELGEDITIRPHQDDDMQELSQSDEKNCSPPSDFDIDELFDMIAKFESNRADEPHGFRCSDNELCWWDHSSAPKHLDISNIVDDIATNFPDVEFTYEEVMNNETWCHEIGCNGNWEKLIEGRELYVFFDNEEQLNLIADNTNSITAVTGLEEVTENKTERFVKIWFHTMSESNFKKTLETTLEMIGQMVPYSELPCIMVIYGLQGASFEKKATLKAGKAEWQNITDQELYQLNEIVERDEDYYEIIMKRDYLHILFKN